VAVRDDPHAPAHLAARMARVRPFRVVEVMERAWALERTGRSVVRLLAGEPDFGTPPQVVEAATRAIATGQVHYTSSLGILPLREAISGYYADRFGVDVPLRRVVVTTGASGALLLALAATVDRDEEVLLTDPGYPCNRNLLPLFEGRARGVPVSVGANYQLTADLVARHWGDATRGVLVASPSNPTGTVVPPAELAAVVDEVHARGGVCYVDELYGELVYDRPPATVLAQREDLFVVNSFSKTFGMTGWRLGWMVVPDWAVDAVERLAQNVYISPPVPAQHGALAAFTPAVWDLVEERRRAFQRRRDVLVAGLRDIGFGVPVTPQGAFYVYAECDRFAADSAELVQRLLVEAGVAATPGDDFGEHEAHRHLRFSYTTALEQVTEALDRMATLLRPG
jgi:aspartate/methionine/tyrosine aminotransferase